MNNDATPQQWIDYINKEWKDNNSLVVMTIDGPKKADVTKFSNQPLDGILYDLNRDVATIVTNAKKSKSLRFINDLALVHLLEYYHNRIKELESQVDTKKDVEAEKPKTKTTAQPRQSNISTCGIVEGFDDTFTFEL